MSHFTVLVAVPEGKTLEDVMLPYHEYECTGIEKYLQFVPCDAEELQLDYANHGNGRTLDDFAEEWSGYRKNEEGVYGRVTNPNAKWDWYQIGGRWSKMITPNFGTKSELDLDAVRLLKARDAVNTHRQWNTAREEAEPDEEQLAHAKDLLERRETWREIYKNPRELALDAAAFDEVDWLLWDIDDAKLMRMPESKYAENRSTRALTHAFIDLEGKWNERGDMGWFALCDDENEGSYDGKDGAFWQFVDSLPDDSMLYLVDCHI
jgi:hypothetical protein